MTTQTRIETGFFDVHVVETPEPTISYRSEMAVYQESLIRGQFVGRNWNGSGYVNPEYERLDITKHPTPHAFWVELDGQLLQSHWEWGGIEKRADATGLEAIVTLHHTVRPVTIRVHTRLDGTPVMTRWLEIENRGDRPAALSVAMPWSGVLQTTPHDVDAVESPYSLGYFIDSHWGNEGDFDWRNLPYAGYRIAGHYRQNRHRHPFFVLRNHLTGEHFVGTLAWSGGYAFEFDLDNGDVRGISRLSFPPGPDAPAPLRVLEAGETISTPEMHLGLVIGDLDESLQALHDHLRKSVLRPAVPGRTGLIESGIGPEEEITTEWVFHAIERAADIGAELFFIDASWYTPPHGNWWSTVGDWEVDLDRFPQGLKPFRDRVKSHGMLWGLWMDAERIGAESKIAKEHPEWFARRYDEQPELRGQIDLTQPAVVEWLEKQINRLITEHEMDFFRLDYNVGNLGAGGQNQRLGYIENFTWRYNEALYRMWERLRHRHPNVIFENCAGGGGRSDVGMIRNFTHTWVTDWQIAPRSVSITNGMTMALPPERIDRLLLGQWGQRTAEFDFQARQLLFVHPTMCWANPLGVDANPVQVARMRHMVEIYKNFVRPYHATSRIFHHTPVIKGVDPHGWGVLELASQDRTRAIAALFRLSDPAEPEYLLRLRGLDASRAYRVTFDNSGDSCQLDGYTLTRTGVPIRLETALTSELLLIEPSA